MVLFPAKGAIRMSKRCASSSTPSIALHRAVVVPLSLSYGIDIFLYLSVLISMQLSFYADFYVRLFVRVYDRPKIAGQALTRVRIVVFYVYYYLFFR